MEYPIQPLPVHRNSLIEALQRSETRVQNSNDQLVTDVVELIFKMGETHQILKQEQKKLLLEKVFLEQKIQELNTIYQKDWTQLHEITETKIQIISGKMKEFIQQLELFAVNEKNKLKIIDEIRKAQDEKPGSEVSLARDLLKTHKNVSLKEILKIEGIRSANESYLPHLRIWDSFISGFNTKELAAHPGLNEKNKFTPLPLEKSSLLLESSSLMNTPSHQVAKESQVLLNKLQIVDQKVQNEMKKTQELRAENLELQQRLQELPNEHLGSMRSMNWLVYILFLKPSVEMGQIFCNLLIEGDQTKMAENFSKPHWEGAKERTLHIKEQVDDLFIQVNKLATEYKKAGSKK